MAKQTNIRRRGKAWVVSARVNGTQQWKSCRTRDEAELELARMIAQRARGETPARRVRATFRVVAEEWYLERGEEKGWRVSTRRDYRYVLDAHLLDAKLVVQVKKGSTGDAVRGVQEVMKFHDQSDGEAPPVQIDGIFGPRTDAWVRGFQTAVGTASDGIVGPITWRALVSGMLSG